MGEDRTEATRRRYNRISRFYDLVAGPAEAGLRAAGLRTLAPRAGERVLEIGFGTGHALAELAREVGESGRVVGVDLSERMLGIAAAKVGRAGLSGRVELVRADAASLPCETAWFDAAFMSFTLELFPSDTVGRVLQECHRVLRPGGRLAVVAMAVPERENPMTRAYVWFHRRFPGLVDCRPIDARRPIEQAGFDIESDLRAAVWGLPVAIILAARRP